MKKYNKLQSVDPNIIKALEELPEYMINNLGYKVIIRKTAGINESGIEHIANSTHGLKVKDIKQVPEILKSPFYVRKDLIHKNRKNYFERKKYKNQFKGFIKIVTDCGNYTTERIVTIYPVDKIKPLKYKK